MYSDSTIERFKSKYTIAELRDCWEWEASCIPTGYGWFSIVCGHTVGAHRVAWEIANGPIPDGLIVMHLCDNRKCVNPGHLVLGTNQANQYDKWRKGRSPIPTWSKRNPKVTGKQKIEIKHLYHSLGMTQVKIAQEYDLSIRQVQYIINGK